MINGHPPLLLTKIFLIGLVLVSCSISNREKLFQKFLPVQDVNKTISVYQEDIERLDDDPCPIIHIANRSNHTVHFPFAEYGIRLFIFDRELGDWQEVENLMKYIYPGVDDRMDSETAKKVIEVQGGVSLTSTERYNWQTSICPKTSGYPRPVIVRVMIDGTVFDSEHPTGEKVAAYRDVKIEK
jgi:hypothetical protein